MLEKESRYHYALDSFKIYYINAGNNKDSIKIEINYIFRNHIYDLIVVESKDYGLVKNVLIRTLHPYAIYGSKFIALMTRATPRDLYDILYMINSHIFLNTIFKK
ncbi:MAG: nucleotidyl transferase AbiEii/AbiGii toxin family protein [Coprobacillus sp.]|nr:nucleotidyl transferase AbiEii/AbiGii toxin family protein [Coprobacillus sp.]